MKIEKYTHLKDRNTQNNDISDLNLTLYKISKTARFLGHIEASNILDMAMVVLDDEEKAKAQEKLQQQQKSKLKA